MDIEKAKIPPNSIDSEQSVLGGLLLHNDAWDNVADILTESDFYSSAHQIIFNAIVLMLEHGKPADILTVKEQVKKTGDEETIGGFQYLANIAENTPSIPYCTPVTRLDTPRLYPWEPQSAKTMVWGCQRSRPLASPERPKLTSLALQGAS